ncbi:3-dehydroquinate dehydratase [Desulfosarcina ovata subsp. sediminis]|uniref:3-dehydroquinate dehydratase n=1 Tax=Desulfosarcina ovata subsp. sediminis TaxID=885957 RepID=A0A5K7ZUX1_9BACT|nr:type I 3-dehydroquinate dehydratase [Desulfosarcina ovata]BBO84043.1 3-dehydroquinate dehydratase [Desulfosarcina ovata subsp. sediminis]
MRLQSKTQVNVRNVVIGGPDPRICIPLVAVDKKELIDQAKVLRPLSPDIIEWRVDGYKGIGEIADCLAAIDALRSVIGDIPLIFTCRIEDEGGMQALSQKTRLALIEAAIRSGEIDIVDIELINDDAFIDAVRSAAGNYGVKLILSYHDFKKTPAEDIIVDKLKQAQTLGADIAKVAVMPTGYPDVLTLLQATLKARTEAVTIPLVTISMAREGVITRMAGGLFGSDITFAIGQASSAPGQIAIGDLRQAMSFLYA